MESLLRYVGLMDRMVRDNVGVKCFSLRHTIKIK